MQQKSTLKLFVIELLNFGYLLVIVLLVIGYCDLKLSLLFKLVDIIIDIRANLLRVIKRPM